MKNWCTRTGSSASKTLEKFGIASATFRRWLDPTAHTRGLTIEQYETIRTTLKLPLKLDLSPKGAAYVQEGDQEAYVDNVLHYWQHLEQRPRGQDPTGIIAALVYTRWTTAGYAPTLLLSHEESPERPARISMEYLPGIRYELALSCATEPAMATFRRQHRIPNSEDWAVLPVFEFQLTGAALVWLDRILHNSQRRLLGQLKEAGQRRARDLQKMEKAIRQTLQQYHSPDDP